MYNFGLFFSLVVHTSENHASITMDAVAPLLLLLMPSML